MSWGTWLPGLVALALGLAAGLLWIVWRRFEAVGEVPSRRDRDLEMRDLVARRNQIYGRLRTEALEDDERRRLEVQAARILRRLDVARAEMPGPEADRVEPERPAPSTAAAPSSRRARPALTGFVAGIASAAVLGLLVYWALRDATPRDGMAPGGGTAAEAPVHPREQALPPELAADAAALEKRLEADPTDLVARKRLALTLLAGGQLFEAFQQAEQVLAAAPGDLDGLYVVGVVRLNMGQFEEAIQLMDQVLEGFPGHVRALATKGLALARIGQVDQALATWELALQAAGGEQPELESLIAAAREGRFDAPAQPPAAPSAPTAPVADGPVAGPPPNHPAAAAGSAYSLHIELAPGARPQPGAVLFVALRGPGGGPPAAVKRIASPSFPLELALTQADSMMGSPLPGSGTLSVRLDADSNVATSGPDDLAASSEASLGSTVSVVLAPSG